MRYAMPLLLVLSTTARLSSQAPACPAITIDSAGMPLHKDGQSVIKERFYTDPLRMLGLAALAFGTVLLVLGLTTVLFVRAGRARAFALALMASQRNMGLMVAATGGALPETVWLYFALCQFPIYLLPQILKPLAARLNAREGEASERL